MVGDDLRHVRMIKCMQKRSGARGYIMMVALYSPLWGWAAVPAGPFWWARCAQCRDALSGSLPACRSSFLILRSGCAGGSARSLTWEWWHSRTIADGCEKRSTIATDAALLEGRLCPPNDCYLTSVPKNDHWYHSYSPVGESPRIQS